MKNNYETLKQILFRGAKIEYDCYAVMLDNPAGQWTEQETSQQLQLYLSLWQVIAEAKLEDEFYAWRKEDKHNG